MPTLKTPSQIAQDYRNYLKGLKPDVNVDQTDSDWWIRSQVVGGVVAGVYADNYLVSNDAFPQQARKEAISQFLQTYFGADPVQGNFLPATVAQGFASVTGAPGQTISVNLQAVYGPNGNTYVVQTATTLDLIAGTGLVPFQSVAAGQAQNLSAGAILTFPSPPFGLQSTCVVGAGGFTDARDPESLEEARSRIVTRIRNPLSVGRVTDYEQYAQEADPSVTSASVARFPYGLGTVAVYITSGTTDVDTAINNGESINVIPSQQLIDKVQAFLDLNRPVTDCVTVLPPVAVAVDVTVGVKYAQGNGTTILSGQTLTQDQLVQREVKRAIYKTPVGGRVIGSAGYVVASDIEQTVDAALSSEPFESGKLAVLLDRQVFALSGSGFNLTLLPNQVPIPGNIVITSL